MSKSLVIFEVGALFEGDEVRLSPEALRVLSLHGFPKVLVDLFIGAKDPKFKLQFHRFGVLKSGQLFKKHFIADGEVGMAMHCKETAEQLFCDHVIFVAREKPVIAVGNSLAYDTVGMITPDEKSPRAIEHIPRFVAQTFDDLRGIISRNVRVFDLTS